MLLIVIDGVIQFSTYDYKRIVLGTANVL